MEGRKNITNTTLCRVCVIKEMRNRRSDAKSDRLLFKIGAILGCVVAAFVALGIVVGLLNAAPWWYFAFCAFGLFAPYTAGAQLLGLKKTVMWCWRSTIKIIPLTVLAVIIFLVAFLFILAIGVVIGIIATPFWLHNARKLLRETAWVETTPEPTYNFTLPPQTQTPPISNPTANYCKYCGNQAVPNANYCKHCGNQL